MVNVAIIGDVHVSERCPRSRRDDFLENVLLKLKYVAERNDKIIVLGDLLNSHSNSTFFFNTLYKFFSDYPNKFHVILGNHDILSRNYDLDKTTIGSLAITGAINVHAEPFNIGGTTFAVSLVDKDIKKVPVDNNENILLGHNYYEYGLCMEESLTREDLKKLNYKYCILGHDHSPYEDEFIENSILMRPGSLTRIDTQAYNKDRRIFYLQYCTKSRDIKKKVVPSLPSNEVYIEGSFDKKVERSDINFLKIANVIEKFKKNSEGNCSLHKVLIDLGTPKRHIEKIKNYYEIAGLIFN